MNQPPRHAPPPGWQPPPQRPAWTPPPPKKKLHPAVLTLLITVGVLFLAMLASNALDSDDGDEPKAKPTPAASAEKIDSGIPPKPDLTTRTAYLADLDAIDPDIVHGEGDKAVTRGRDQCSSFKTVVDGKKLSRAKLIDYANYRFTSPNHPNGHGTKMAEQILDVVHKHLCPKY